MILDRFFLTRSRFWELVDNGREDFFFPPLPLQDIIIIIIILPVRGYRGYSTRLKKEKQILDNNLKINNSIARRDYSISKYSIDIVTYHFEEWKNVESLFCHWRSKLSSLSILETEDSERVVIEMNESV